MAIKYIANSRRKNVHAVGGNYRRSVSDVDILGRIRGQAIDRYRKYILEWGNIDKGKLRASMVTFCSNYTWNDLPFGGYSVEEFVDEYVLKDKPVKGQLRPITEESLIVPGSYDEIVIPDAISTSSGIREMELNAEIGEIVDSVKRRGQTSRSEEFSSENPPGMERSDSGGGRRGRPPGWKPGQTYEERWAEIEAGEPKGTGDTGS